MKRLLLIIALLQFGLVNAQITLTLQPDGSTGKDALMLSCIPCGYSTTNYGSSTQFNPLVWTNGGDDSFSRGIIEFDISSIPVGAVITQANLSLYHDLTSAEGQHSSLTGTNASVLQRVTSMWDENTVTWNTQPSTITANEVILPESVLPTQDYPNIDVTNLVQDMIDNPATSFGFLLKAITEIPFRKLIFASSDHLNSSLHPKLEVIYLDVTGVNEINATPKQLLKIVDLMGRETEETTNTPLLYIYSDGSVERVFKIEE